MLLTDLVQSHPGPHRGCRVDRRREAWLDLGGGGGFGLDRIGNESRPWKTSSLGSLWQVDRVTWEVANFRRFREVAAQLQRPFEGVQQIQPKRAPLGVPVKLAADLVHMSREFPELPGGGGGGACGSSNA